MLTSLRLILAIGLTVQYISNVQSYDKFKHAFDTLDNEIVPPVKPHKSEYLPTFNDLYPEATMNVVEMVRYNGYPVEEYEVNTEDGYILTIQRIPYGKSGPGNKQRQPVIVQHGMFCTSILWVFNTPARSLGFILADNGYDVWLSNVRGNTYGRKHVKLNPDEGKFWDFSFDEMGKYDMPAVIDFVLSKTGFTQTNYIGHSMGTTLAFIMFSDRPEYNNKIRSAMLLAPTISQHHHATYLRWTKPFMPFMQSLSNRIGGFELFPYSPLNDFISIVSSKVINNSPIKSIWHLLPDTLNAFDFKQFNVSRLPIYAARVPSGTSLRTLTHYGQLTYPGSEFRHFDFGHIKNNEKYGLPIPPKYNLKNVTVPIALFWGEQDLNATPKDVAELAPKIRNLITNYRVPSGFFTHEDFVIAIDVKPLIYDKVLEIMQKQWPQI